MPWGSSSLATTDITGAAGALIIGTLITANEVKSSFISGVPAGKVITIYSDANLNVYTCFNQEAKSPNQADVYTNATGLTGATCPSSGTACYFCAR